MALSGWTTCVGRFAGMSKNQVALRTELALTRIESLPPEVITRDIIAAIGDADTLEDNAWNVLIKDGVWPGIEGFACYYAGDRLCHGVCHCRAYQPPLEAYRAYKAGKQDKYADLIQQELVEVM